MCKTSRAQYLKGNENKLNQNIIARFRCGNEELKNRYWETEERRKCRICGAEEENLEHLKEKCKEEIRNRWKTEAILNETGEKVDWM